MKISNNTILRTAMAVAFLLQLFFRSGLPKIIILLALDLLTIILTVMELRSGKDIKTFDKIINVTILVVLGAVTIYLGAQLAKLINC